MNTPVQTNQVSMNMRKEFYSLLTKETMKLPALMSHLNQLETIKFQAKSQIKEKVESDLSDLLFILNKDLEFNLEFATKDNVHSDRLGSIKQNIEQFERILKNIQKTRI